MGKGRGAENAYCLPTPCSGKSRKRGARCVRRLLWFFRASRRTAQATSLLLTIPSRFATKARLEREPRVLTRLMAVNRNRWMDPARCRDPPIVLWRPVFACWVASTVVSARQAKEQGRRYSAMGVVVETELLRMQSSRMLRQKCVDRRVMGVVGAMYAVKRRAWRERTDSSAPALGCVLLTIAILKAFNARWIVARCQVATDVLHISTGVLRVLLLVSGLAAALKKSARGGGGGIGSRSSRSKRAGPLLQRPGLWMLTLMREVHDTRGRRASTEVEHNSTEGPKSGVSTDFG